MDDKMGKNPASQFYWGDWINDVELQSACSASRGIWINALARMWFSKTRGELIATRDTLSQILNCTSQEFDVFLREAETLHFCYICVTGNGCVTLRNRRMFREEKERETTRLRVSRYREKQKTNGNSNGDVTPPSSSSSSSSIKELKDIQILQFVLRDSSQYELGIEKIKQYKITYPNIEIMQCLRECVQWNVDNLDRRKTKRGILKHINTWLQKAQKDRGYIASAQILDEVEKDTRTPEEQKAGMDKLKSFATNKLKLKIMD